MFKYAASITAACCLLAAPMAGQQSDATAYPARSVRIIVSSSAGGGVDMVTRMVAEQLRQRWGQSIVIDNRASGAGNVAAEAVAVAEPDGYTLLAAHPAPLTINSLLQKNLPYDATAFEPVAIMTSIPNTLTVRRDFPANSVREFIAYAKVHPGKVTYGSSGTGTTPHLTAEFFQLVTGTKFVHVPYKGTAPALNDLIAGHIDLIFAETATVIELHKTGQARILAFATLKPLELLPDVPTLQEAGLTGFESSSWNAIVAPPKTPAAIVAKLNQAINDALKAPDVRSHFAALNLQPLSRTPTEAAEFIRAETRRWGDVIRSAHMILD